LKERERAADDLVLGAGADAPEYAGHLLEIARSMQLPAAFGWAAIAMARRPQLEDRLLAILDSARDRTTPHRGSALALSLAAIGILVPVAALQAKSDTGQAAAVSQATAGSAAALIEEGDAARGHHRFDEAKKLYGRALKAAGGSGPEAATALIDRGEIELAAKDHALAEDDFEKAEAADSGKASEARMWTAISQQHQNNLDAADGFYQSALAADDPNSASAATIMELYAKLLRQQDKNEEAKKMRDQAATIRATQAAQARSMNQPSSADVRRIGGDVKAPVLVSKVEPEYSEEGRIAKYDGSALLSIEVGADGLVRDIKVVRGLGFGLDLKAVEAVSKWRFKPATENGQAVTVSAQVEVRFRLL
jgi:TonB family protein